MPSTVVLNLNFVGGVANVEMNRDLSNITSMKIKSVVNPEGFSYFSSVLFLRFSTLVTGYGNTGNYDVSSMIPLFSESTAADTKIIVGMDYPIKMVNNYLPQRFQVLMYFVNGLKTSTTRNIIMVCEVSTDDLCG